VKNTHKLQNVGVKPKNVEKGTPRHSGVSVDE